jgi:signal peptidase II
MNLNTLLRYLLILLVIAVNIGCDQISKSVVRKHIEYSERIPVVDDNIVLTKVENSGAFLSLGDSLSPVAKDLLLLALPVLSILIGIWWLFRQASSLGTLALVAWCCVLGGGIGNMFDRALYGSVTDFMFVQYGFFRTGIFNAADVSITGGILVVLGLQLFGKQEQN